MPTTKVTPELGKTIKELRKLTDTTSKDIADLIGKSTGYISNVENCKTPTIDCQDVFKIFKFLEERDSSISSRITHFLDNLKIDFSESEIEERQREKRFYIKFDEQYRVIHIENSLVEYLKNEISNSDITDTDIMQELNSNRYLSEEDRAIEPNLLHVKSLDEETIQTAIKFELPDDLLNNILKKKIRRSNYITLLGIVYALQLLKGKDVEQAKIDASNILYSKKIYTLDQRNAILKEEEIKSIISDIKRIDKDSSKLPQNEIAYYNIARQLVDLLGVIKDNNVDYTANVLYRLVKNLKNYKTMSMSLALIGMDLKILEDVDPKEQISIFKEMRQLMEDRAKEALKIEDIKIIPFD